MVAAAMRTIFAQPDAEHVREAADDITAFADFPVPHWKKIWSTNPRAAQQRNQSPHRRGRVFPNPSAAAASYFAPKKA